ncbi:MAG: hypothetical protein OER56_16855 [Hyphomicrobiales bacterium]|nr:hypothetical protein [Hyphomicrobiales bacterium]
MKTFSKLVLFVLLLVFSSAELAIAKKGRPGLISVPAKDPVVKVIELPDTEELKFEDGVYIDIGYLHHSSSTGEWVGYLGSGTQYLSLSEDRLKQLMQAGNVAKLPPPPSYNVGLLDKYGVYLLILGAILILASLKTLISAVLRSRDEVAPEPEPEDPTRSLEVAMAAAVKQSRYEPSPTPVVLPLERTPVDRTRVDGNMSFGKRA